MGVSLATVRGRLGAAIVNGSSRRAMGTRNTTSWHPSLGIRFSPSPPCAPLYPRLDVDRFLHTDTTDGRASSEPPRVDGDVGLVRGADGACSAQHDALALAAPGHEAPKGDEPHDVGTATAPGNENTLRVDDNAQEIVDESDPESIGVAESPSKPRAFTLSTELFKAAKAAQAGTPASYWSHALYESVNAAGDTEKVKVHYCTSKHVMESVCQKHFLGHDVLGLDLEWSMYATRGSGPRANVSLIQLASSSRIGLFQLGVFEKDDFVAPTFRAIMEDPNVTKAGVNIRGDCTRLKNNLGINVQGVFELSHMYKQVKYSVAGMPDRINKSIVAMSIQVEEHLGLPIYKESSVRMSDWQRPLTASQILYSAADAYAGLQLYHALDAKRKELKPCPPRPHHAELNLPIPRQILEAEPESQPASATGETADEDTPADASAEPTPAKPTRPATVKTPQPRGAAAPIRDARVLEADRMAREFRASKATAVAPPMPVLRAYYIWHVNEDLDPSAIAKLLCVPPLKTATVITYLLEAVVSIKMPYSRLRLKKEVLSFLHPTSLNGPYRSLVKDCEDAESQTGTGQVDNTLKT